MTAAIGDAPYGNLGSPWCPIALFIGQCAYDLLISPHNIMIYRHTGLLQDRRTLILFTSIIWRAVSIGAGASLPTANQSFGDNFFVTWGEDHVNVSDGGAAVDLKLDDYSGCGFASNHSYLYGYLSMDIKLAVGDSAGTITTFYLSSDEDPHEELDFEFLGNKVGQPIVLQTNVFANGTGGREQRINLWFDPTANFHTYSIVWNIHQIIFFVDGLPIRVFPNRASVPYPSDGHMRLYSTFYNGDNWATDGGQTKVNWTNAPFIASYQGFFVDACEWHNTTGVPFCSFVQDNVWWGGQDYKTLNSWDQGTLEYIRNKSLIYDYCMDNLRYPMPPQECI